MTSRLRSIISAMSRRRSTSTSPFVVLLSVASRIISVRSNQLFRVMRSIPRVGFAVNLFGLAGRRFACDDLGRRKGSNRGGTVARYRVGIIACGGIARAHAIGWSQTDSVEIAVLADTNPQALAEFGDTYGVPAERRYSD